MLQKNNRGRKSDKAENKQKKKHPDHSFILIFEEYSQISTNKITPQDYSQNELKIIKTKYTAWKNNIKLEKLKEIK